MTNIDQTKRDLLCLLTAAFFTGCSQKQEPAQGTTSFGTNDIKKFLISHLSNSKIGVVIKNVNWEISAGDSKDLTSGSFGYVKNDNNKIYLNPSLFSNLDYFPFALAVTIHELSHLGQKRQTMLVTNDGKLVNSSAEINGIFQNERDAYKFTADQLDNLLKNKEAIQGLISLGIKTPAETLTPIYHWCKMKEFKETYLQGYVKMIMHLEQSQNELSLETAKFFKRQLYSVDFIRGNIRIPESKFEEMFSNLTQAGETAPNINRLRDIYINSVLNPFKEGEAHNQETIGIVMPN